MSAYPQRSPVEDHFPQQPSGSMLACRSVDSKAVAIFPFNLFHLRESGYAINQNIHLAAELWLMALLYSSWLSFEQVSD